MRLIVVALLLLACMLPAKADDYKLVHKDGLVMIVKKPPFKERHPIVYRRYRKVRHVCVCLQPIISAAGSAAQIVTSFR